MNNNASSQTSKTDDNVATVYRENPGQTLGIAGIITNAVGINIAGIILGVMSRNKSREAGMSTTLGTVSLIWGIVGTAFGVLAALLAIMFLVFAAAHADELKPAQPSPQADYSLFSDV